MATSTGPPSMTIIHAQGDVILKLSEGESTTKLLVSSQTLALASSVFKAMFNGKFAEGQGLSSNTPREVELPDDDSVLMTILCNIAHLRASDVPKELSFSDLADVAILCDKYACLGAVHAWIKVWIQRLISKPNEPDYQKLVLVTYIMDLPKEFYRVTQSVIRDRAAILDLESASHGHHFMPAGLLFDLQQMHTERQGQASQAFHVTYNESSTYAATPCDEGLKSLGEYLQALMQAKLWPMKNLSILELQNRIRSMADIPRAPSPPQNSYYHSFCPCQQTYQMKHTTIARITKVYDESKGFCLDCVKREEGMDVGQCRVQHI